MFNVVPFPLENNDPLSTPVAGYSRNALGNQFVQRVKDGSNARYFDFMVDATGHAVRFRGYFKIPTSPEVQSIQSPISIAHFDGTTTGTMTVNSGGGTILLAPTAGAGPKEWRVCPATATGLLDVSLTFTAGGTFDLLMACPWGWLRHSLVVA